MVEFSDDENKVTVGGHRYRAAKGPEPGRCIGCAFIEGFGCRLVAEILRPAPYSLAHTKCTEERRKDRRSIIWVLDLYHLGKPVGPA